MGVATRIILPIIGVQNLFCLLLECKIYFAMFCGNALLVVISFLITNPCSYILIKKEPINESILVYHRYRY